MRVVHCIIFTRKDFRKIFDKFFNKTGKAVVNGRVCWYKDGKLHRIDGPAYIDGLGTKHWYINGELHREDGPAVEHYNGVKEWCMNGYLHRTDGPAVEYPNGDKEWFVNGEKYSEKEFNYIFG